MSNLSPRRLAPVACAIALAATCSSALGVTATWSAVDDSPNNHVNALDVNSGTLWAGGDFTQLPFGTMQKRIGQWNGSTWNSAGVGVDDGSVLAIQAVPSGPVYVGGTFMSAGGSANTRMLAKWDGSTWSRVGDISGASNEVRAMAFAGGNLYVGGKFYVGGGSPFPSLPFNKIAKFDGTSWSAVGTAWGLNITESVNALAVDGAGNVYAGGDFTTVGGAPANYLAKWDGTSWSAVGTGVDDTVYALALDGSGNLYVGGSLTTAGGVTVNHLGKWNGSSWSALGTGTNDAVLALNAMNYCGQTALYAGGPFTTAGGAPANHIAAWTGGQWSQVGAGLGVGGDYVRALAAPDPNTLYAGGSFIFPVGLTNKMDLGQAQVINLPCAPTAASAASTTPGEAVVMWSNPASGPDWTNLVATASPGGATCSPNSATETSCTIQGLTNGTAYTFTVKSTNSAGDSPLSNTTAPVTPAALPGAPTGVTAVAGQDQATVSWTAPASNGGAAITAYTATATPGGRTCTTTGSTSCTVTGLTVGTAYTFVVTATNRVGTSAASAASASVTPTAPSAPVAPVTPPAPPADVIPNLGGATAMKNGVGTTTGTVPPGATSVTQTATTGGSTATEGFLEMARAKTAKAKTAKGKCAITVVRNKKTKKVTKRTYTCRIRLAKGTWTVTTTARGAAGVVAESSRRVVVK